MINVELTVNRLNRYLNRSLMLLSDLDVDNFEQNFNIVVANMKKAKDLKKQVDFDDAPNAFDSHREGINFLTKQIQEKYDNIVKKYEDEISEIAEELKIVRNKKKIMLYTGGK
jgi:hypothetical protein